MSIIERAKKVLEIESKAVAALIDRVGLEFVSAVELIDKCRGRLIVTGIGKSGLIGKKIASTFASMGVPALFMHPVEGVHGDLGMVVKGDVLIAISKSGETEEILKLLSVIKRFGIKLIALTGNPESTLARRSDVVLNVGVSEEACVLDLLPTASTTATLAMGDALAVTLLEKRGFSPDDLALLHPGGVIGKKLLLLVGDLMHSGNELPLVREEATLKDVIYEISSKRLGVTSVVDGEGTLKGIVTDGDLRRLMERQEFPISVRAADFMTKNPKTIEDSALAAEALQVMEKHSITSLLILNGSRQPKGIIHLHDILRSGVV
ncbi:MAG: KpsF/GutQ family sugar-phosphate isomerase [Candidatus Tectomicrobia bacterium]|uniref:KpsF/GutQ family sugar-phosphate isomerase n=1 Tax=Tectimicrobiota bacterium TaxID=2528274 RepID=A0A932GQU4_UNCTE|nr:KpsF/GutQ family sugar-phosphate isomerase [Candidatus Tectomicrobia bacterium]